MSAFVLTVLAFRTLPQLGSVRFLGTDRAVWWTWVVTAITLLGAAITPFVFGKIGVGDDGLIIVIEAAMAGLGILPAIIISPVRKLSPA